MYCYYHSFTVGTKSDLRNDSSAGSEVEYTTKEDAMKMVEEVGAVKYMECSALTQEGVKEVFDEAIRTALKTHNERKAKTKTCSLL